MKWLLYLIGSMFALVFLFAGSYGEMPYEGGASVTFVVR